MVITKYIYIAGVLTDADSIVLEDLTATFGVKRTDTDEVVVPSGTAMTRVSTGVYTLTVTEPQAHLTYEYWMKVNLSGVTFYSGIIDTAPIVKGYTIVVGTEDPQAVKYDLLLEQGTTYVRTFTWVDALGAPVDLTDYSLRMQIRPSPGSSELIASSLGTVPTIVVTKVSPESGGQFTIAIDATTTAGFNFTRASYDLEAFLTAGVTVHRLLQGAAILSKEVTVP
jgi:hypothetical protein